MTAHVEPGHQVSQRARFAILCSTLFLLLAIGTQAVISSGNQPARANVPQRADPPIQPTNSPAFQRTKTLELAPAQSLAPATVPGQTQVDANTIALYHFDAPNGNLAMDATGNYTGTLYGNAAIAPTGLYSGVLSVDGNSSYVRLGNLGSPISGTVEAFVDYSSASCPNENGLFPIIYAGGEFASGQPGALFLGERTGLAFGIYANGQWNWANSGINGCRYLIGPNPPAGPVWPYETWRYHHIAGTWGPRGMEIWVDGVLHGVGTSFAFNQIQPYPYMCNPQAQMGVIGGGANNPLYPVCQTPVMAPTMPAYPPSDYVGGLLPYATFLVGCGADWSNPLQTSCFRGRIDEVRISNIQRTFQCLPPVGPYGPVQCVVPTLTPTPTNTPVPITGEYSPDAQTVALYHLNYKTGGFPLQVLESENNVLHYIGGSSNIVNNGRFGMGFTAPGVKDAAIGVGNLGNIAVGTLETWADFTDSTQDQPIFSAQQQYNGGFVLYFGGIANGRIRLNVQGNYVDSDVTVASLAGCWHHIAGTFGPRGMEVWIDGALHGTNPFTGGVVGISNGGWKGACSYSDPEICIKGFLDEVRVSSVQRTFTTHSPQFLPVAPSAPQTLTFFPLIGSFPSSGCVFGP